MVNHKNLKEAITKVRSKVGPKIESSKNKAGDLLAKHKRELHFGSFSVLEFKKLDTEATMPHSAHEEDAGYDLYANEDMILTEISPSAMISTGIAVNIPAGYVGYVASRSGLAAKNGVQVLNAPGVVDSGYTGEVKVILHMSDPSKNEGGFFKINKGDRIAQLIIQKIEKPVLVQVEQFTEDIGKRGSGGFGSTGS